MVPFSGWEMPVQYDGVIAEHHRTRNDVALFDTCHMAAFRVTGGGSLDLLSRLLTADLRSLADGRCRYGFILRQDGGILDDAITYRLRSDHWMVVVNAGTAQSDFEWFERHAAEASDVTLEDLRPSQGKLDLQGPRSSAVMAEVFGLSLSALKGFGFTCVTAAGVAMLVSRTGYTGEIGYELYAPLPSIPLLWDRLIAAGVRPAGLGSRDTLRLEAGLPLYGHELSVDVTPVEAGLMRYASKDEPFIGRSALLARQAGPRATALAPFRIEGRQTARNGHRVRDAAGADAGFVTSGSFSPTLGHAIGFAYVRPELAVPGQPVRIDAGRCFLEATVTTSPFYRRAARGA